MPPRVSLRGGVGMARSIDEIEKQLNRICFGGRFIRAVNGSGAYTYIILQEPNLKDRLWIDFIYEQALIDGKARKLSTSSELLSLYREYGVWTEEDDKQLKGLQVVVGELQKNLNNPQTSKSDKIKIERVKRVTDEKLEALTHRKAELFSTSLERFADGERTRVLAYCCAYRTEKEKFWPTWESFEAETDTMLINSIISNLAEHIGNIDTKEVRELARSPIWRVKWQAAKNNCDNLFGKPLVYLTRNQESLIYWSQVYDAVYESMDRPPDDTINDDELLDEWFDEQAKKRKQEELLENKSKTKPGLSGNISKHGEIGIVTNPAINHVPEWVRGKFQPEALENQEVYDLNDPLSKKFLSIQGERIKKAGVISEQELRGDKDSRRVVGSKDAITHKAKGKDGFTRRVIDKTLPGGTISGKRE